MFRFDQISNYYPIKSVVEVKKITKGSTSNAQLIITADAKYILRNLKDTKQAESEYIISKELSTLNISPAILLNNNNHPYFIDKQKIYNLQIYIENHQDKNVKINFYELGKITALFHSKIKEVEGIYEQVDRFSLRDMMKQLLEKEEFLKLTYKAQLLILVEQCLNFNHKKNCYIHGDLGIWNLLFVNKEIYIIDYGEVRKGNNHFDISAVISSTIDWKQGEDEILASLTDFKDGYLSKFDSFNWKLLKENLILWFTRGIIALLINKGINEHTINYLKVNLERLNKLDRIIERNFIEMGEDN